MQKEAEEARKKLAELREQMVWEELEVNRSLQTIQNTKLQQAAAAADKRDSTEQRDAQRVAEQSSVRSNSTVLCCAAPCWATVLCADIHKACQQSDILFSEGCPFWFVIAYLCYPSSGQALTSLGSLMQRCTQSFNHRLRSVMQRCAQPFNH